MDGMAQARELLGTIDEARAFLAAKSEQGTLDQGLFLIDDILAATETVHTLMVPQGLDVSYYNAVSAQAEKLLGGEDAAGFIQALEAFVRAGKALATEEPPAPTSGERVVANKIDMLFYRRMDYFRDTPLDKIIYAMKKNLKDAKAKNQQHYHKMLDCYNTYNYWGGIDPDKNQFELITNRASALKDHYPDFIWLYERLCDVRSKKSLLGVIDNWFTFDYAHLNGILDKVFEPYFDADIIQCDMNEVLVDLGAYVGDTVVDYVNTYATYKKIYCYEILPQTMQTLQKNLKSLPNIEYRQKGASDKPGTMFISDKEPDASMHKLSNTGTFKIQTVAIDDDITEPVTFIKMDIEGAEQRAIIGCKKHIKATHPKLAIAVYHNNEDIWKCARLIDEIDPNYRFYFRYYGWNIYPTEYVLLGV